MHMQRFDLEMDFNRAWVAWYADSEGRRRGDEFLSVSFLAADFTCQQPQEAEARLGPLGLGSCQVHQFLPGFTLLSVSPLFCFYNNSNDLSLNSKEVIFDH
jgi:hypothetical protein